MILDRLSCSGACRVEEEDTWETLAARVLAQEHQAYVQAVQLFAQGRLRVEGRRVRILPPRAIERARRYNNRNILRFLRTFCAA
jgi:hypothetical protein